MDISISQSVGFQGANQVGDVRIIQEALKEAAAITLDPRIDPGTVDGECGVGTEGAIARFQGHIGLRKPDAKIDPNGYTLKRLNALLVIGATNLTYPFARFSDFAFSGPGSGMRAFASRRGGGQRAHAGIDLYFPDFTTVLSMADGVVTRGPHAFYLDTFAVEIDHGAFLARYGEIAPETVWPVEEGDEVERGQPVGRVGILKRPNGSRLGVPSMMLHLEIFDKTESGNLTRAAGTSARTAMGVPFFRRRDLVDPSGFVHRSAIHH